MQILADNVIYVGTNIKSNTPTNSTNSPVTTDHIVAELLLPGQKYSPSSLVSLIASKSIQIPFISAI